LTAEFKKRNLKTSEKTAKKNKKLAPAENPNAIPVGGAQHQATQEMQPPPTKKQKKVYTPFPPPQQPSKVCLRGHVQVGSTVID
jgi:ribosomal RNA assembly protein